MVYRLEIWDNDSISGPKKGTSQSFVLSVRDDRAQAAKEGEEAQQIADALLELLADQLEELKDREDLAKGMEEILRQVERNLDRMRERMDRFDLEALRRNLLSLKNRVLDEPREKVTQEMERLALLAEDIAKRARMNEVEALAKETKKPAEASPRFHERPERTPDTGRFRGGHEGIEEAGRAPPFRHGDPEQDGYPTARGIYQQSRMLRGLEFQDLFKDLEEIQKKLMAGDLAGALEAAQRLLQALSEMMADLGRAGTQAGMASFDRLQGEMARQAGELDKILAEQREILRARRRGSIERSKRKAEEETGKELSQSLPDLKRHASNSSSALPSLGTEGTHGRTGEALLKGNNLERFSQHPEGTGEGLSGKGLKTRSSSDELKTP